MFAEIVTIGDEILIGQMIDSNSAWIAQSLNEIGISVIQITSIPDQKEMIHKTMDKASDQAGIILLTGGLGPTSDDITKTALAEYFSSRFVMNEEVLDRIHELLSSRGVELNELNRRQALLPDNCEIIPNKYGTASGMWFRKEGKDFISMPGVPYEMMGMMTEYILPELRKKHSLRVILHKTILTQGIPESYLARILQDYENTLSGGIKIAYLPSPGIVRIRLSITGKERRHTEEIMQYELERLMKLIPDYVVGLENENLEKTIGELLISRGLTLATAESCTGGNIAQMITSVAGSSNYYIGSVIAYSNDIKERILGVNRRSLDKSGAVCEQVVREMSEGVRKLFRADYAIATSGIAGPDGGTVEKPVGTTWIAIASERQIVAKEYHFGNQRTANIQKASQTALNMLRKLIIIEK